jgi:hypothetical protein
MKLVLREGYVRAACDVASQSALEVTCFREEEE